MKATPRMRLACAAAAELGSNLSCADERRLVFPAAALQMAREAARSLPRPQLHDQIERTLKHMQRGLDALRRDVEATTLRFPGVEERPLGPNRAA
ncbi:hypothetical protein BH11PLA1_BH11PLA1_07920 [soil metagenome]